MDYKSAYMEKPWLRVYPKEITSEMKLPEVSVIEAFDDATERWKNKTALVFYGKKFRYSELRDQVDRLATALHHLGVKKGDRVALHLLILL